METGLRGYQYTGRVEILQPYTEAARVVDSRFAALGGLVADDASQRDELAVIRSSPGQWRLLATTAIVRRADHSIHDSDAMRYNQTLASKASMDVIRAQYEAFISGEALRRSERVRTARSRSWLLIVTCVLIALGGDWVWCSSSDARCAAHPSRRSVKRRRRST